ncbi:alpha/beta hydrolase [Bacteroides fragilis]|nr:alpha/beta hydrolase [Bacteroides fragilis]UVQ15959.1 alpha/beta hydrolase [Bacteroides fragilis]
MRKYLSFILLLIGLTLQAQETYKTVKDISYIPAGETDGYRKERCKLDVYYPVGKKGFPTIVWFHGGGLEGGGKHVPEMFMNQGFAVVAVNYRLSPKAQNPAYTEDAAAAVAWAYKHIEEYGGSPRRVFVTGHSAGGYLTLMVGLDKSYLREYGVDADSIAAYLPISGQTVTHFTIRKERSLPEGIPVIDQYAPCNKARKDTPPFVLITGDRNLEMADRYEENALLASVLKNIGNKKVSLYELQGFDHGQVYVPGCCLVANYIRNFIADGR